MALTDPNLQSNAVALLFMLHSSGCSPGFDADVQTFQQSYVAAGGVLPASTSAANGVDGLYGANTQAALQAVIDANPNNTDLSGETAPGGCVPPAGGGGGGNIVPPAAPTTTFPWTPVLVGAGVLAVLAVGVSMARKPRRRSR